MLSELKNIGIETTKIEKHAQELDEYYISTRYPGQYGGPEGLYTENDALSAIEAAEKIIRFASEK